jgi:protein-tyrosine phosphatase
MGKKNNKQQSKQTVTSQTAVTNITLPPLPVTTQIDITTYRGPTEYCNWVIPNILLVGGFPRRSKNIDEILGVGIDVIVCLVEKFELERVNKSYEQHIKQKNPQVQVIFFPIVDRSIGKDEEVEQLVIQLSQMITQGRKVFTHCVGGHGRGGTIACLLLARLYTMNDSHLALNYIQLFHDQRIKGTDKKSPQASEQRNQIHRLVNQWFFN